jgi:hypothetical protein
VEAAARTPMRSPWTTRGSGHAGAHSQVAAHARQLLAVALGLPGAVGDAGLKDGDEAAARGQGPDVQAQAILAPRQLRPTRTDGLGHRLRVGCPLRTGLSMRARDGCELRTIERRTPRPAMACYLHYIGM